MTLHQGKVQLMQFYAVQTVLKQGCIPHEHRPAAHPWKGTSCMLSNNNFYILIYIHNII